MQIIKKIGLTGLALLMLASPAWALSTNSNSASGPNASVVDPDEQHPALVGKPSPSASRSQTDAEMDQFSGENQAPSLMRQAYKGQGFDHSQGQLFSGSFGRYNSGR